jgi:hypothetical protein
VLYQLSYIGERLSGLSYLRSRSNIFEIERSTLAIPPKLNQSPFKKRTKKQANRHTYVLQNTGNRKNREDFLEAYSS